MKRSVFVYFLCATLSVYCGVVEHAGELYAQSEESPIRITAEEIYSSVMSPFCPGRLLRDCPSSSAVALKEEIYQTLENGDSQEKVMESLVNRYGDEVLATPPARGFGLFAWITPALFLLGGFLIISAWLKRQRRKRDAASPEGSATPVDSALEERIQREL